MNADMNARLADLALRMATVFSAPATTDGADAESAEGADTQRPHVRADSLLGEDLPQLAEAMLVLALRMLDPILSALRGLAAGTPEAALLDPAAGPAAVRFDSHQVRITTREGQLVVTGCQTLPVAFLPWMASHLVGAGALLVPRPFADPDALRRHIGETLQRIERLTDPQKAPSDPGPDPVRAAPDPQPAMASAAPAAAPVLHPSRVDREATPPPTRRPARLENLCATIRHRSGLRCAPTPTPPNARRKIMAFWKKTGYVAGMASGILPVVWMGRLTWRAGRAMIPPLQAGDLPEDAAPDAAAVAAARFARAVAAQQLSAADLQRAQRRAQWRMHLSALGAAVLLVYGTWHPAAWTFLPLCAVSWIYGRYQSDCLVQRALPLFRTWLLRPFQRWRQEHRHRE